MGHDTFLAGDLTAVIGDNFAEGSHNAGYNGLWSLTHRTESASLFVPGVAGLNLEHIFDGKYLLPRYEVTKEYQIRVRAAYRERCSRDQIRQEYKDWRKNLAG